MKRYAAIIAGLIIAIGGGVVMAADNFGSVVNFYNSAGDTVLGSVVDGVGDFQSLEIQSTALASSHLSDTANIGTLSGTQTFTGDKTFSGAIDFATHSIPIDDMSVSGASTDNIIAYNGANVVWTTPVAVSLPQALDTTDSPTFLGATLTGNLINQGQNVVIGASAPISSAGTLELHDTSVNLRFYDTDATANQRLWYFQALTDGVFNLAVAKDDGTGPFGIPLSFTRSASTITDASIAATNIGLTGAVTASGDVAVNGGDITTTASTLNIGNTTPTTIGLGGAATTVSIGAATGTATIRNATTNFDGDVTIDGGDISSTVASMNVFNGTATTVNAFGAATAVTIGAGTGTATIRNATVDIDNNMTIGGTISDDGISGNNIDLSDGLLFPGVELASENSVKLSADGGTYNLTLSEQGYARLPQAASDPVGGEAGAVYYNTSSNVIRWHNGSTWANL